MRPAAAQHRDPGSWGAGFLERHRILGVASALAVLIGVGLGVGEVLGRLLVELIELGVGAVDGEEP